LPISASDIKFRLAVKTGSAGNSLTSTPAASLGKYVSTTDIVDDTLHNLFDAVSGDENAASDVEYRCVFVVNTSGSSSWTGLVLWIDSQTSGGATVAVGKDPAAASAVGSASAQAAEIANESTAPAGVTFSTPTDKATGIAFGDLAPGECRAFWVRRTAANSAALDNDGAVFVIESS
jgi:hypothetical protein